MGAARHFPLLPVRSGTQAARGAPLSLDYDPAAPAGRPLPVALRPNPYARHPVVKGLFPGRVTELLCDLRCDQIC